MAIPYVAFDLETAEEEGATEEKTEQSFEYRPSLGITCAAVHTWDGASGQWHGTFNGFEYAEKMEQHVCDELARYLHMVVFQNKGPLVTWNGLGFDFRVLADEVSPSLRPLVVEMALNHVDMAWAMLCDKGYMCSLANACKGMEVEGKTEGMSGEMAPVLWRRSHEAQKQVLAYVQQDARATGLLYDAVVAQRKLVWMTVKGMVTKSPWYPRISISQQGDESLYPVSVMAMTPEPDTSWMDQPWDREKFIGWTSEAR